MLRSRPTQRWVDCGRHHGRQTGRRARQFGLSPRHDFLRVFFRINWDTSTGRPYYKSPGENVCVRFGWGEDLGKHAPARHGSPLPFGRTRSKRIVDDPARNQCLGARSLGQTLVKLDRAESRRRTLRAGHYSANGRAPRQSNRVQIVRLSREPTPPSFRQIDDVYLRIPFDLLMQS